MKTLKLFILTLFAVLFGLTTSAQTQDHSKTNMTSSKTETIKVWGNCDICKARIEKTVTAEGATKADWNTKTKLLAVTFDPSKTSVDDLSKKLAAAGHDTEKYKADDKAYDALPGCCHYTRAK